MTNMDLNKIKFLKLLNLGPTSPEDNSFEVYKNHTTFLSNQYKSLADKNNSIKTGYENFHLKKGTTKLYPFKDFDFIGRHVVCQKCCQKFASIMAYRVHIGTSICIRTYNGPNLVYLKYKNRNCRRIRKKNKNKLIEDLHHDIKKNLLNPEMLNTLQTRNNCYSDVVYQRNKIKEKQEKQRNNSNKNDDPSVKKPRGRPRKNIEVEPKKRGRPKKLSTVSVDSLSQNNNDLNNSLLSNDDELKESKKVSPCNVDDAFNNNVNGTDKLKLLSSKMKILNKNIGKIIKTEWKNDKDVANNQNSTDNFDLTPPNIKEKQIGLEVCRNLESLKNDLKLMSDEFQPKFENPYKDDLELMLSKLNEKHEEYQQCKIKKTDMNNASSTNKGKENIQHTFKNNDGTENDSANTEVNSDNDIKVLDEYVRIWLEESQENMSSSEDSDSIELIDDNKLASTDSFEETSESSDNVTLNFTSSVSHHSNYPYNQMLDCKKCDKNFASIAEWKMHHSEHLAIVNKTFLCKICGLKFKVYANYVKHVNLHGGTERKIIGDYKTYSKKFVCKKCGRQYNYLKSYFSHIKIHMN